MTIGMLKELRKAIATRLGLKPEEVQKVHVTDYFDFECGTSTGVLIAAALVYRRMSLEEIERLYIELSRTVGCGMLLEPPQRLRCSFILWGNMGASGPQIALTSPIAIMMGLLEVSRRA